MIDPADVELLEEALSMRNCPYYNGAGICNGGCHDEPRCQTDEPSGGWDGQIIEACRSIIAGVE